MLFSSCFCYVPYVQSRRNLYHELKIRHFPIYALALSHWRRGPKIGELNRSTMNISSHACMRAARSCHFCEHFGIFSLLGTLRCVQRANNGLHAFHLLLECVVSGSCSLLPSNWSSLPRCGAGKARRRSQPRFWLVVAGKQRRWAPLRASLVPFIYFG